MFSQSSTLQLPCCLGKQEELSENVHKTSFQSSGPSQYCARNCWQHGNGVLESNITSFANEEAILIVQGTFGNMDMVY